MVCDKANCSVFEITHRGSIWDFPKIRGALFGVLIIRILQFMVLCWGPLFSETPIYTPIMELSPQNHKGDGPFRA